jgi:hypothetical protein
MSRSNIDPGAGAPRPDPAAKLSVQATPWYGGLSPSLIRQPYVTRLIKIPVFFR